jgi:hypothetical protein
MEDKVPDVLLTGVWGYGYFPKRAMMIRNTRAVFLGEGKHPRPVHSLTSFYFMTKI